MVAIISFILYIAGIITGISVQNFFLTQTELQISQLEDTINSLKTKTENLQIENLYLSTLGEKSCNFLISSSNQIQNELSYFWDKLPKRLEEYEKTNPITPEYAQLKRDYTFVVLRSWLISLSIKEKCNKEIIPTLYFYSKDCNNCIEQGKILDQLKNQTKQFSVFIIDFNSDEPVVKAIKDVYNITQVPSFVINNIAFQGFKTFDELRRIIIVA